MEAKYDKMKEKNRNCFSRNFLSNIVYPDKVNYSNDVEAVSITLKAFDFIYIHTHTHSHVYWVCMLGECARNYINKIVLFSLYV